jgi:hypothetical protein
MAALMTASKDSLGSAIVSLTIGMLNCCCTLASAGVMVSENGEVTG